MGKEFNVNSPEEMCDLMCGVSGGLFDYEIFRSEDDRKSAFRDLAVMTGVVSEECFKVLAKMGFFTAPASTKYHGCYKGGLFDHSYYVAITLDRLTDKLELCWEDKYSPIRIGLLHDLCKVDQYTVLPYADPDHVDPERYEIAYNKNTLFTEHGTKSALLAQQLPHMKLTEEELACIVYHMGAFTDKEQWNAYTNAIHKYPNVLWTHTADMFASHVLEVM